MRTLPTSKGLQQSRNAGGLTYHVLTSIFKLLALDALIWTRHFIAYLLLCHLVEYFREDDFFAEFHPANCEEACRP